MKASNILAIMLLIFTLFACEDVLESDISNQTVTIFTPKEGAVIESNVASFQWETLKGAVNYRLQIVNSKDIIVKDTLLNGLKITLPLKEDFYKWKVRAENTGYQSNYSIPQNFQIKLSTNLTNQQVLLVTPSNEFYTNSKTFNLNWNKLSAAQFYAIEIANLSKGNSIIYQKPDATSNLLTLDTSILAEDGRYEWRIKAINSTSETIFNTRIFNLDTQKPNQPLNLSPAQNTTYKTNQSIDFSWKLNPDSGTIQSAIDNYIIEFAKDADFKTILQSSSLTSTEFRTIFTATGDYYWRIQAKDKAGNISEYSSPFKVTIN